MAEPGTEEAIDTGANSAQLRKTQGIRSADAALGAVRVRATTRRVCLKKWEAFGAAVPGPNADGEENVTSSAGFQKGNGI